MRGIAALFREFDQQRHLHAVAPGAVADAVDQARTDDDGAASLVVIADDEMVQCDARDTRRRRRDRRVLVKDVVGALAAGARADDAGARGVDEGLAAAGERIKQGCDRAPVVGTGGIDDDVRLTRGAGKNV